jgi:hypothetical protein
MYLPHLNAKHASMYFFVVADRFTQGFGESRLIIWVVVAVQRLQHMNLVSHTDSWRVSPEATTPASASPPSLTLRKVTLQIDNNVVRKAMPPTRFLGGEHDAEREDDEREDDNLAYVTRWRYILPFEAMMLASVQPSTPYHASHPTPLLFLMVGHDRRSVISALRWFAGRSWSSAHRCRDHSVDQRATSPSTTP